MKDQAMQCHSLVWIIMLDMWIALPIAGPAQDGSAASERAIRRSDVVFMYDNPDMYEPYGCTVLGWAGSRSRERIELAHSKGVRRFSISVGFLTEFRGMIDFSDDFLDATARNFAGEPFIVPWLWDHKHKGQPAWWWCTNSPLYRKYLESLLEQRMSFGPDGLHIDDYRGSSGAVTWRSACFCRHCMAGFRKYLAENVSAQKLHAMGITDLNTFDYRQFLIDRGVTPADYRQRRSSLPLADTFYDFHVKANTTYIGEYRKKAERICGRPLSLCVNSGLSNPQALAIAPQLSYFCCEVPHHAASPEPPRHPIAIYKLGDGLNRPITSTASGQDWAYVNEHNKPCLVRTWIVLSYALGHNLMAPHRQWCYTQEKGTHWYSGPTEQYAPVYQFIRQHARLFDNYEAVAPVAVVYDNAANRKGHGKIEPICVALAERNVPFTVVIAGDDWLDYRLDRRQLSQYKAVIAAAELQWLDQPQRALLAEVERDGRLLRWPDDKTLARLVPSPVSIEGSAHVMVVPRADPSNPIAPVVVHLLNRQYDGQQDAMVPQQDLRLHLRRDLFGGRRFSAAMLYAPGREPTRLTIKPGNDEIVVPIPQVLIWALLELSP